MESKMIPIVINNRNRLTTTKKLVERLVKMGYNNIHIIDNDSTYHPLLNWYEDLDKLVYWHNKVKVIRLNYNSGQLALWNAGLINCFQSYEWIVYTDSDIEIGERTQPGFLEDMIRLADAFSVNKVGLALRIDDLPYSSIKYEVIDHEKQFWENRIFQDVYIADVDTTFAIIKPNLPFQYNALRLAGEYTARHVPWYVGRNIFTKEEKYVMDHSDPQFSTTKGRYIRNENKIENK